MSNETNSTERGEHPAPKKIPRNTHLFMALGNANLVMTALFPSEVPNIVPPILMQVVAAIALASTLVLYVRFRAELSQKDPFVPAWILWANGSYFVLMVLSMLGVVG